MVAMARDAFGENWLADVTRFTLCAVSFFLVMVCIRVAYMRARSPRNDPQRERSPWALLSYGCFAFIPTVNGFRNLGNPLDPLLTPIFVVAILSGVVALFGQVTIKLLKRPAPPPAPEDEPE